MTFSDFEVLKVERALFNFIWSYFGPTKRYKGCVPLKPDRAGTLQRIKNTPKGLK